MNVFILVWNYLKAKSLNTIINMVLLALGITMITSLLLFSNQLQKKIESNAKGIDLVVGAKGSPLQLILCNIFHIDFPTGNIKLKDAESIATHPLVKQAIPLSLGDSYQNFRIIGATPAYADLYQAKLAQGDWYDHMMEVVIGSAVAKQTKLNIDSTFSSAHGLSENGHHHEAKFTVTGILEPTGTVLDDLILTPLESVWEVHEEHEENEGTGSYEEHHESVVVENPYSLAPSIDKRDTTTEITSMLIRFRSPMGMVQLPRYINSETKLQAASPAFESARLFSILGVGFDVIRAFAYVIVGISGLSIFIALYNSLNDRLYDLAVMRTMGASRLHLVLTITLEGVVLTSVGCLAGLFLGHLVISIFSSSWSNNPGIQSWDIIPEEVYIFLVSVLLGIICSAIPAYKAYRIDIHHVLAG